MDLVTSAQPVALIIAESMEDVVEEMDSRILKETECHLETIEVPHMEKGI